MFKRKKSTVKPDLPKEYVWALEIEGEDHEFKCLVTEDEVITYEDGREHKHLKVVADFDPKIEAASADYQELTRLLAEKEEAEMLLMDLMEQWEKAQE